MVRKLDDVQKAFMYAKVEQIGGELSQSNKTRDEAARAPLVAKCLQSICGLK